MQLTQEWLDDNLKVCVNQLSSLGFETGKINGISANKRDKSHRGRCLKYANSFDIEVMQHGSSNRSEKEVLNTLMHETIHTIDGCFNHKEKFLRIANIVNTQFGYAVKINTPLNEKESKPENMYAYTIKCTCCGHEEYRHNKPNEKRLANSWHESCGEKSKGSLKIIKNNA